MSAVPRKNERRLFGPDQFTLALITEAESVAANRQSDQRIARAREADARELTISWETPDGRDAEMRSWCLPGEPTILARRLERLDLRTPTPQEQATYAMHFDTELNTGGDLWRRVMSHLWEQSPADLP